MGIQNMKNRNVGKYKRPFYPLLKLNAIQYIKICEIKPRQYIRETFIALRCFVTLWKETVLIVVIHNRHLQEDVKKQKILDLRRPAQIP